VSSIDWRPMGDAAVLMALPGTAVGGASGAAAPKGVREVVVGLDSVLLRLEPGGDPAAAVRAFAASLDERADGGEGSTIEVPTAFDGDDLATVAAAAGLAARDVVELMVRATFEVAAIGFSPGFPYLRGLPAQLAGVGRRPTPRPVVPAGSVAVAGGMGAIYPQASPGGWQLVGRTPLRLFDAHRAPYALFAPGDRLHFVEAPAGVAPDTTRAAERRIGDEGTVLVEDPGTYCTVQDAGRRGVAHLGVPDAGAADAVSLDLANRLVGNDATAPALEATVRGPVLRFGADTFVAVVGDCGLELDGIEARPGTAFPVRAGQRLTVGALRSGVRAYVAFAGGVLVDAWFDSASTDTLSGLGPGPVHGVPQPPGDVLDQRNLVAIPGMGLSMVDEQAGAESTAADREAEHDTHLPVTQEQSSHFAAASTHPGLVAGANEHAAAPMTPPETTWMRLPSTVVQLLS